MLPGDGVVLQRLHQRQRHGQRDRGGQRDPHARELRRGDGQGQHHPVRQPGLGRVFLHHAGVAEHLPGADVEGAVDPALQRRRADEVVQHVPHGDRLDLVPHPAGGGHHRQRLGQVPDHLEGRRAGADDDAGLEHHRVHRRRRGRPCRRPRGSACGWRVRRRRGAGRRGRRSGPRRPPRPPAPRSRPSPFPWPRTRRRPPSSGPGSRARRRRPAPPAAPRRRRGCSGPPRRRSSHGTPAIFAGVRTRTFTRCPASSSRGTSRPPM